MKLSIITPFYKCYEEFTKLVDRLIPQLNNQIEWIIVDDGCHETRINDYVYQDKYIKQWNSIHIWHLIENSGGASLPRNIGLDNAKGNYIAFVDADDNVSINYIEKILEKTKEEWDYCYLSWSMGNQVCLIENEPPSWNCCVWNCIYKKELIGEERFRPDLIKAEDYDFNKRVRKGKKANITDVLYYYNTNNPYSLSKGKETYNPKYKSE